jgi:hypothetical protein
VSYLFNNRLFREGLAVVAKLTEILLLSSTSQDAEVGQQDEASFAVVEDLAALRELHSLCASCATGKRHANQKLVCAHNIHDTRQKCLSDECESCGFKALWMSVRKTLVFDVPAGKLRPGVSEVWTTEMIWDLIKSSGDGSKSEDDLRQQHWDPSAGTDDTSAPVAMLVNSSELRAADFPLAEVRPLIYISTRWLAEVVVREARQ